jgi:hypothetical protein
VITPESLEVRNRPLAFRRDRRGFLGAGASADMTTEIISCKARSLMAAVRG